MLSIYQASDRNSPWQGFLQEVLGAYAPVLLLFWQLEAVPLLCNANKLQVAQSFHSSSSWQQQSGMFLLELISVLQQGSEYDVLLVMIPNDA